MVTGLETINKKQICFSTTLKRIFKSIVDDINFQNEQLHAYEENIRLLTQKEEETEIKTNICAKKTPGFDLITGEVLKHLQ